MSDRKSASSSPTPAPTSAAASHPASGHRTPREIAKDETGPIGLAPPSTQPNLATGPPKEPTVEQKHIRAAVQRSAKASDEKAGRRPGSRLPPHHSGGSDKR